MEIEAGTDDRDYLREDAPVVVAGSYRTPMVDLGLSGYASNLLIATGRLEQLRMLAEIDRLLAALRGT